MGLGLLAGMIQRPAFHEGEIESEHHVVLEEISMNGDDPSDVAHDQFAQALWGHHVLALPVLGTKESISEMTRDVIAGYWKRPVSLATVVVAANSNLVLTAVVDSGVRNASGAWSGGTADHHFSKPAVSSVVKVINRDTEQAHLVIGSEALDRADERRFSFGILNHVLGGGVTESLVPRDRGRAGSRLLGLLVPHALRRLRCPSACTSVPLRTRPHRCWNS